MATDELISAIKEALAAGDQARVLTLVEQSDPGQWPAVIPQLNESELPLLVEFLPEDELSDLLLSLIHI